MPSTIYKEECDKLNERDFKKQTEQHAQVYKLKINNGKEKYLTLVHITWALIMI